jgi:Fe-S cluster biogenesis protein NfuA
VFAGFLELVVTSFFFVDCCGCQSSDLIQKQGILSTLQYHIPEVISVALAPSGKQ